MVSNTTGESSAKTVDDTSVTVPNASATDTHTSVSNVRVAIIRLSSITADDTLVTVDNSDVSGWLHECNGR